MSDELRIKVEVEEKRRGQKSGVRRPKKEGRGRGR